MAGSGVFRELRNVRQERGTGRRRGDLRGEGVGEHRHACAAAELAHGGHDVFGADPVEGEIASSFEERVFQRITTIPPAACLSVRCS